MSATNPTIARLDRFAARAGVSLASPREHVREFALSEERTISYRPGGKGVVRVKSYVNGVLDAEAVVSIERAERLIRSAA